MKALLVLLPAVALTLMSATDTPAAMQPSPSTTMVGSDATDQSLADKIRAMFSTDEAKAVKVEVANRVATLKGKVNSEEVKAAIAKKVAQVKELKGVNNQLETK